MCAHVFRNFSVFPCALFLAQPFDFANWVETKSLRTCVPTFCHTPIPTISVLPSCNLIVCPRFVTNRHLPTLSGSVLPSCNLIVCLRCVANRQPPTLSGLVFVKVYLDYSPSNRGPTKTPMSSGPVPVEMYL